MTVFYVTAGVFLFGAIFYALFGSGEIDLLGKFKDTNELWKKLHIMPEL